MSLNTDQSSFLQARDPSIAGWGQRLRFVAPVRKQLFNEILEDESKKSENAGIGTYLRLKSTSGSADQTVFSILNETTIVTNPPKESVAYKNKFSGRVVHQYTFSKVFSPDATQKEIFDECVAYRMKDFILGSNCLVFSYGTTNAGKTFTIQGNGCSPGIIPRAIDTLFKSIGGQVSGVGRYKPDKVEGVVQVGSASMAEELDYKNRILQWNWDKPLEPIKAGRLSANVTGSSEADFISTTYREMQKTFSDDSPLEVSSEGDVVYSVWVSFAEVYNESIFDLLDPITNHNRMKRIPLKIAQDSHGNTFIRDLKMIHVSSGDEAFHVMLYGKANLQIAATNMNMCSSRSHCIFTVRLVRYANSDNPSYAIVSSFTFCDLAGAERAKKTMNAGERLKESNSINTSLHVLGRCLATIRENQKRHDKRPVPFRDSKLTRMFQRALTGHECITMIVNANMSPVLYDETVNVLKFSAIAKQIVLEAPIKNAKPPKKKSRFSILASRPNPHGTVCWDAPLPDTDTSSSSTVLSTDVCIQQYNAQNEELLKLTETLKAQLKEEREKNLTLERETRRSLTGKFTIIISDMENSWKARLHDVEERSENLYSWRLTQLENYYKKQLEGSRKRRRSSDEDDSIIDLGSPKQDNRIKELEEEVELLESKCSALHQLLKEAQDIQTSLSGDNSSLKFEVANANAELEKCRRQLLASAENAEGVENALTTELQLQLSDEKKKLEEEINKNESLRKLLDEAGQEFIMLSKEKEESDTEITKLQNDLVEKVDELAEVNQQLEATQQLLSHKSHDLDKLEEKYETAVKLCESHISAKQEEQVAEELQTRLQSLTVSDEMECEITRLKNLVAEADHQNDASSLTINQLQEDIKLLQKDLKEMLQKDIKTEQQLKDAHLQLENSQNCCRLLEQELKVILQKSSSQLNSSASSQIELETLGTKVRSYEETMKFFKDWKEEAKRENEQLKGALQDMREENQRREEQLNLKEDEVETIKLHRENIVGRYEDALKKMQEELEREKREVIRLRDTLYKSTPTPKKNESAEIRRLKDLVESLQTELGVLKKTYVNDQPSGKTLSTSATKSAKKAIKYESISSNESLKENAGESFSVPSSASKSKRAEKRAEVKVVASSDSELVKEKPEPPPSSSQEKQNKNPRRKLRKLFAKDHSQESENEALELVEGSPLHLPSTTVESFVKRSLRKRKV